MKRRTSLADLAEPDDELAQLLADALELGREPLERRQGALGGRRGRRAPSPSSGSSGRGRAGRALAELGDVPHPLPLGPQGLLLALAQCPRCPRPARRSSSSRARSASAPRSSSSSRARRRLERPPGVARLGPARGAGRGRRTRRADRAGDAGRASRRCANCPESASSRSVAATRSSRATLRPHAYARERPSCETRRATTSPGSSSGRRSRERLERRPRRRTRPERRARPRRTPRSPAAPTAAASPFAPSRSPIACVEDRLPRAGLAGERDEARRELELRLADQDEVLDPQSAQHDSDRRRAPRPADTCPTAGLRREALAVAADERRLGERREQRCGVAEPTTTRPSGPASPTRWPSTRTTTGTSGVRFQTTSVLPRGTTSGRAWSECGATKVVAIASIPHISTGPPFERLYAVEPDGVEQIARRRGRGRGPRRRRPTRARPCARSRPT